MMNTHINDLQEQLARVCAERDALKAENARLKKLAPEHFQWTGGPDQTDDPLWIIEGIKEGWVLFDGAGTPDFCMTLYDEKHRVFTAYPGDWIVRSEDGPVVIPRAALGDS